MTALSSNVNVTEKYEPKQIIVHENLSDNSSMDVKESERKIFKVTLSQNNSVEVSEYTTT